MASATLNPSTGSDPLLLPSKDPWYTTAPPDLEAAAPGTVLRIRTVPVGPAIYSNASAAYHILYRSTGSRYQPIWAVTSLVIPKNPTVTPSGHNALLSYQIAYNSPNIDWGPSYRIFQPPLPNPYGIPTDHEKVNLMLGRGWYVAIPDFEGAHAAFSASVLEGHAVLDGFRAILSLAARSPGISPAFPAADRFKYAMWGYSGGSLASEKAAELQVQYAPELEPGAGARFVGAALGGLVSSMAALYGVTNKTPFVGNLVLVLLGIMNEYPELKTYLEGRLRTEGPQDAAAFLRGREMDSLQAFQAYAGQDLFGYFVGGEADLAGSPLLRRVRKVEWTLGYHGVPEIPLYVYKAVGDEMTPIADTDAHIEHYKRFDVDVLYERNTVGGHIHEIVNGQDRALEWLAGAFDGSNSAKDPCCTVRDVAVDVYKLPTF